MSLAIPHRRPVSMFGEAGILLPCGFWLMDVARTGLHPPLHRHRQRKTPYKQFTCKALILFMNFGGVVPCYRKPASRMGGSTVDVIIRDGRIRGKTGRPRTFPRCVRHRTVCGSILKHGIERGALAQDQDASHPAPARHWRSKPLPAARAVSAGSRNSRKASMTAASAIGSKAFLRWKADHCLFF